MDIEYHQTYEHLLQINVLSIEFRSGMVMMLSWHDRDADGEFVDVSVFQVDDDPPGKFLTMNVARGAGIEPHGLVDMDCDAARVHAYFDACVKIESARHVVAHTNGGNGSSR